jgi:flagellar basal body-associated protein FliL
MSSSSKAKLKGKQKHQSGKSEKSNSTGSRNKPTISTHYVVRKKDQNLDLLKQKAQEQFRKKQLRRQIREKLDDLLNSGEQCEPSQIFEFIDTFCNEIDLLREVLNQFSYQDDFPISIIRVFASHASVEEIRQLLAERQLKAQLVKKRNELKSKVPEILVIQVEMPSRKLIPLANCWEH